MFNVHSDSCIGYKELSDADLGRSADSHQTHIGLFEKTLNFLKQFHKISIVQFIYLDTAKKLICFLDYITNPNGTSRSPKIREGNEEELYPDGKKTNSVVREIRHIVESDQDDNNWYLMWFGLSNNDLVFFLFDEKSDDYIKIKKILGTVEPYDILEKSQRNFGRIIYFLNKKVINSNLKYLEKLEELVQTENEDTYFISHAVSANKYDFERAKKYFKQTGQKGEKLTNDYLSRLKNNNSIKDFQWVNKNGESGKPYDFEIINNDNKFYYSDVKSTAYKFEQNMIFSGNELRFINLMKNYLIHRVYSIDRLPMLRLCKNIGIIADINIQHFKIFYKNIKQDGFIVKEVKIAIPPNHSKLHFGSSIRIN